MWEAMWRREKMADTGIFRLILRNADVMYVGPR